MGRRVDRNCPTRSGARCKMAQLRESCRAPSALRWRLVHQLGLERVANEFGVSLHTGFFQTPSAIGTDGFYAEGKLLRPFLDGFSTSEHPQDLKFAVGEKFVERKVRALSKIHGQLFREGRAYVASTGDNFFDRAFQFIGHAVFGLIARSARF